ncbi:MAG: hypothetical protein QOK14_1436 [Frankiaceae bacterium]|nr:hypothetical protein [Frankiaceae bacterium]
MLPSVTATRYVTPLREGGSLPGLIECDDLGTYVVKFRGAGQGPKALVAEVVAGELGRRLGLRVPDLVTVELDPLIARAEPDEEVQDLLRASEGCNLGMDYLPGSIGFDAVAFPPDAELSARVLWFDALIGNVDRSWRNTNLLMWHGELWLIDHGASLYFHHNWARASTNVLRPYDVSDHVLAPFAKGLPAVNAEWQPLVTRELLTEVLALVPDEWLEPEEGVPDLRSAYVEHLVARVAQPGAWLPGVLG